MKAIIYVAVVMNWAPADRWWIVDGPTKEACQEQERELRSIIDSDQETCVSVYVKQHELMKKYHVQWAHDKGE